ncbi:helix-hairpin-helix domain-containing protein [Acetilactobacillus jinshanensis]|uniref:ComEA family DNA-binding protein n=1 Tax=Acetilactobacillus jinshanensis TaxID=1720083 RepID=A0A4P6ZJW0_9LACO|nr:helix-hairpin-helix domain-containing protein [Acetilactobacillus jinshanensis]QBP17924.1 ComEA family DNA-binding protein [Acetilactobacillus jinshanensis]URL60787.1 ComEA family DNA-binding protein [uncultured bacterium]
MDRIKEIIDEYKLKIIITLFVIIGILLIALFIMMTGQHSDQSDSVQNSQMSSTNNMQHANQTSEGMHRHYQSEFIDIEGAVKRPGVYQFTNNMRIDDAVNLAGGLNSSADRKHINLAKKLIDQQTVYIPVKGEIKGIPQSVNDNGDSGSGSNSTDSSNGSGKINLNTADVKQLQTIDGIGEKRAEKIIDYRKSHGNFSKIDDVKNISGIGDKFLANIKAHVTL